MSDFTPTAGQAEALRVIREMPKHHPGGGGVAVVSGYAGSGKTTLLKVLAEEQPGMFVLTPTGKAAVRVREAAGCEAMTIHRWQYTARKDETTGEYSFEQRPANELQLPANRTLIIDEASMISRGVWEHLYFYCQALGLNIVLIGDGFQLPPVEVDPAKRAFSVFAEDFRADHRVTLTEVLRQALESPIIRISNLIRTETDITSAILQLDTVTEARLEIHLLETLSNQGVAICHRNATRHHMNVRIRELRGLTDEALAPGEPLLVTKNNYRLEVFNGEVFTLKSLQKIQGPVPVRDQYKNISMFLRFQEADLQDLQEQAVICPEEVFGKTGSMDMDAIRKASRGLIRGVYEREGKTPELAPHHMHANLGYVLTCHKSQGSEWADAVVLMEPSVRVGTIEGRRWVYTALTRAKNRVRVCWL